MEGLRLEALKERLANLDATREALVESGREISRLSKRLVSRVLRRDPAGAEEAARELSRAFESLVERVSPYPELYYSGLFYSVAAEYVEAQQLFYAVFRGRLGDPEELRVHPAPYVLGTAELIGELKRLSLELLRSGEYSESFRYFELAEEVYERLSELDFAEPVVPGLRRRLDVYRKVIDDWRVLLIDIESRVKLERACRQAERLLGSGSL